MYWIQSPNHNKNYQNYKKSELEENSGLFFLILPKLEIRPKHFRAHSK